MQFPYAKKSLGQNFLTSQGALSDIISAADVQKGDEVLEIGPGRGILTAELLEKGASVTAIEKDSALVIILQELFKKEIKSGKLRIIEGDILEFDIVKYRKEVGKYKLIANIPYYITGQIFRMFLEGSVIGTITLQKAPIKFQPICMTMLVQKEVAERIITKNGKESILSLSVKAYGEPVYISTVKRGSFNPPPNVDSAILHIRNISKKFFTDHNIDEKTFFAVVKVAFAHKRKVISKNLFDKGFIFPDSLSKKARAEDLTLLDFALITQANIESKLQK